MMIRRAGFKGIGLRMAQKLGGRFHYLEDKNLTELHPDNYINLKSRLEELAQEKGLEGRLKIEGYNFHERLGKENVFNPYVGLIKEADHRGDMVTQ